MVGEISINARRAFPQENSGSQLCPSHTGLHSEAASPSPESRRNSSRNRSASSVMPCWTAYSKSTSVRISASVYLSRRKPAVNISQANLQFFRLELEQFDCSIDEVSTSLLNLGNIPTRFRFQTPIDRQLIIIAYGITLGILMVTLNQE